MYTFCESKSMCIFPVLILPSAVKHWMIVSVHFDLVFD